LYLRGLTRDFQLNSRDFLGAFAVRLVPSGDSRELAAKIAVIALAVRLTIYRRGIDGG
jgi:hypothetical protein